MRHFLSVCLSVCPYGLDQKSDWIIILILLFLSNYNCVKERTGQGQRTNFVTEWAHCQRQVAFLVIMYANVCK